MVLYPLSKKQKDIVKIWLSKKDKPLFIVGDTGTGKTCLANELLKKYHTIIISTDYIKYTGDLISYIKSSLFKKNILMMCSNNHYKALLIDNFESFIKHDKTNASKLLEFVKNIHKDHPIIIISNKITNKIYETCKQYSYCIECRCSMSLCKKVFKNDINTKSTNLHELKNNLLDLKSEKDIEYSLNDILERLVYKNLPINELFLLSSSEYTTISLNLLENSPTILNNKEHLYSIYKSICISDMYETKYIDKSIELNFFIYLACVIPSLYLRRYRSYKHTPFIYNKYVSKSLIQIHNQSLLSSFNYIELLNLIYNHQLVDNSEKIGLLIQHKEYDKNTLLKQIKVYNYFYNKNITKKYIVKTLKNISNLL